MKEFIISERYRLELHWYAVDYLEDGLVLLRDSFFSGPVLSDIVGIQPNDSINMDFGKQYSMLLSSYYIANLSWNGLTFNTEKILLSDVMIKSKHINSIPKLRDSDYIVIDTSDHEVAHHYKNLNYRAYLLDSDGQLYNFRR